MLRAYLPSVLVVAAAALALGCDVVGDDECGDDKNALLIGTNNPAQLYDRPDFTSFLLSGRRHFNWSFLVEDICSSEPAEIHWQVLVQKAELPPGWQVTAGYATTAVTGTDVTLTASDPSNVTRVYEAVVNVGMAQGSILGVSRLAVDIEFAFTSQGDFQTDREVAQLIQPAIDVWVRYKAPKSSASAITAP
jgi:hypothetical protein